MLMLSSINRAFLELKEVEMEILTFESTRNISQKIASFCYQIIYSFVQHDS